MDFQQDAIYGYAPQGYQTLGADMLNPMNAQGPTDWNALISSGIRGAAQGAMMAQVQGAYASGQLVPPGGYQATATQAKSLNGMLLLAGLAFLVMGGD